MRGWHELVAAIGDRVPGGVTALGMMLLVAAGLLSLLWYWFPEWLLGLGRGLARFGRALAGWRPFRRRKRRRGARDDDESDRKHDAEADDEADDELADDEALPEVAAAALALSADELAAQGRFREAVRERLRAIVRDLVERGVIDYRPGWTVTELATMGAAARPAIAAPLAAASEVFSRIWYGQQLATAADDAAMREHASQVRTGLGTPQQAAV